MKKVCIALGQPTIDMPVKGKDASGQTAVITAVFKRYNAKGTQELLDQIIPLSLDINKGDNYEKALKILRGEIVALKEVSVYEMETGEEAVKITDTRSVTSNQAVSNDAAPWERGPETCLEFLLDLFLDTPAWGAAFVDAFFAVHNNKINYVSELAGN